VADRKSRDTANQIEGDVSVRKGLFIGIFQSLALIPGISRSGITISGGLISRLSRTEAIRYAFLLGIPVILGAMIKTILDTENVGAVFLNPYVYVASLSAFASGLWSINFLVKYLKNNSFSLFIIYRVLLAIVILVFI
jgi:undecaprenyl-diphosphatase